MLAALYRSFIIFTVLMMAFKFVIVVIPYYPEVIADLELEIDYMYHHVTQHTICYHENETQHFHDRRERESNCLARARVGY